MKKNFKKLGLKILTGLLLCSCISGSKTMAMSRRKQPLKKPPIFPVTRQQRRDRGNMLILNCPNATTTLEMGSHDHFVYSQLHRLLIAQPDMQMPVTLIGGQTLHVNTTNLERNVINHIPSAMQQAKEYFKQHSTCDYNYIPICRTQKLVIFMDRTGELRADLAFTCQIPTYKKSDYAPSLFIDGNFVEFLNSDHAKQSVNYFFSKQFNSDKLTQSQLPGIVKTRKKEAKVIEENRTKMLADEKAATEERKKLMEQFPPDYTASSLDEFSMMISDEKLQEMRKAFEASDKAQLAEKMNQKRPKSYFPEAKERTDMVEIETHSSQIPINDVRDLAPYCSPEHKAFISLCKFLTANLGLKKQTLEVCEQVINHFGKAMCPVTRIQDRTIPFGDLHKPLTLYEVYINNSHRALFVKLENGPIQFIQFGGHM